MQPLEARALLATVHWDGGGVDNNWSTSANWVGDAAPQPGDDLVFDAAIPGVTQFTNNNDLVGLSVGRMTINSAATSFVLNGNAIAISDGIVANGGTGSSARVQLTGVELQAAQTFSATGNTFLLVRAPIDTNGHTLSVTGDATSSFDAPISGSGGLRFDAARDSRLRAANTYSGLTQIENSFVQLSVAGTLGDTSSPTDVIQGTLSLSSALVNDEYITLAGSTAELRGQDGAEQRGDISLATTSHTQLLSFSGRFTVSGAISGNAGTTGLIIAPIAAGQSIVLAGANTFAGTTQMSGTGGVVKLGADDTIPDGSNLDVHSGAILDLDGHPDAINGLSGGGVITNNAVTAATLTVGATSGGGTFSGTVTDGAGRISLSKVGSGTQIFSGNNTYSGATLIYDTGSLKLGASGVIPDASAVEIVDATATLNLNNFSETIGSLAGAGSLSLGSGTLITVQNNASTSFSGAISGAGNLIKQGSGTWRLSGDNTYAGTTTVSAGWLIAATDSSLGATSGGTLVTGTGGLTIGPGVTTDEPLTIDSGRSVLLENNAVASGSISLGGTVLGRVGSVLNGEVTLTDSVAGFTMLSGPGSFTINGRITDGPANLPAKFTTTSSGAVIELTNAGNDYNGATEVLGSGQVALGASGVIPDASVVNLVDATATLYLNSFNETIGPLTGNGNVVLGTGQLTVNADTPATFAGTISGAGNLLKRGFGAFTLSGHNTHRGTIIEGGTLRVGSNANVLPDYDAVNNPVISLNNNSVLDLNGFSEDVGAIASTHGTTIALGSGSLSFHQTALYGVNGSFTGTSDSNLNVRGYEILFGGANNVGLDGTINVYQGMLVVGNQQALGSTLGGTVVHAGGVLLQGGSYTEPLILYAGDGRGYGALENYGGNSSWAGPITLAGSSSIGTTFSGNNLTVTGPIDGPGGLTVLGQSGAIVTLGGSNTYDGSTTVSGGVILRVAASEVIPDGSAVTVGGTLDLNDNSETIGSLAGTGSVTLDSGTLTTGGNNASTGFDGVISGAGGVIKRGTGTWTLRGNNTYAGATHINGGTINLQQSGTLGTTNQGTTVSGGAALELEGSVTVAGESLTLLGHGLAGTGALRSKSGTNHWQGPVELNALNGGGIGVDSGSELTVSGQISGGSLAKWGSGRLILDQSNTYAGVTEIIVGSLQIRNANALGSTSAGTTVHGGAAWLELAGNIATAAEPLRLNGGFQAKLINVSDANTWTGDVTLAAAATIAVPAGGLTMAGAVDNGGHLLSLDVTSLASEAFTLQADIMGSGGMTKSGPGIATLNAAATYAGPTTVTAGLLLVHGSLLASSAVTVMSGATLGGRGTIIGPVTVAQGGTMAPGASSGMIATGDIHFQNGSSFTVEIGGATPGNAASDHDQLVVTGAVTLDDNVTLNLVPLGGFAPDIGQSFTIVDNDGTTPNDHIGAFAGLPDGTIIESLFGSGLDALIRYFGGDGNDITLSVLPPNRPPTIAAPVTSNSNEDAATYTLDLLLGATDPDAFNVLSVSGLTVVSGDDRGIVDNGDNQLLIDPSAYNDLVEGETVVVVYSYDVIDGRGGSVAQTATISIEGRDEPPTVAFLDASSSVEENSVAHLTVVLDSAPTQALEVQLALGGTATQDKDFTAPMTVVFAPGQTAATLDVSMVDDTRYEPSPSDTVVVTLLASDGVRVGATSSHTVHILDNDVRPDVSLSAAASAVDEQYQSIEVTIRLSAESDETITVPLVVLPGQATLDSDFTLTSQSLTLSPGQRVATTQLTIVDDVIAEPAELIRLGIGEPTNAVASSRLEAPSQIGVLIRQSDVPVVSLASTYRQVSESTGSTTVLARLAQPTSSALSIPFTVTGTAAGGGVDYSIATGTFEFAPNSSSTQATINIVNDTVANEGTETITLQLGSSSSAPATYYLGAQANFTLDIVDDDVTTLSFEQKSYEVWEDAGSVVVSVKLSKPSASDVFASVALRGVTATSGVDYSPFVSSISIPAGQTSATTRLYVYDDSPTTEPDETVTLSLWGSNVSLGNVSSTNVVIRDDDPTISLAVAHTAVQRVSLTKTKTVSVTADSEDAEQVKFRVTLNRPTNKWVSISYSLSGTASGGGIDYTAPYFKTVWIAPESTFADIVLDEVDDLIDEKDETITASLKSATYAILPRNTSATFTINDDDSQPTVSFVSSSTSFSEVNKKATGSVKLSAVSGLPVDVTLAFSGAATRNTDYKVSSTTLTIPAGQTSASFTLTSIDDSKVEGDEAIVVTISSTTNAPKPSTTAKFTATIVDNDTAPPLPPPPPPQPIVIVPGTIYLPLGSQGLLSGATVFLDSNYNGILDFVDSNGDGVQDEEEPEEVSAATGINGQTPLFLSDEYDLNSDGVIDTLDGRLVLVDGTDSSTGLPLKTRLTAPIGFLAVTSLSTLTETLMRTQGFAIDDAILRVSEAFDIVEYPFANLNPLVSLVGGDASAAGGYAEHVKLSNAVIQLAEFFSGRTSLPVDYIANLVYEHVAERIVEPDARFDTSVSVIVQDVIRAIADQVGAIVDPQERVGLAEVIAASGAAVDALQFDDFETPQQFAEAVVRAKQVAQGDAASALHDVGAGARNLATTVQEFSGDALQQRIAVATVATIVPATVSVDDAVVVEGQNGTAALRFAVSLIGDHDEEVRVSYFTADDSATANDGDYEAAVGDLVWSAGEAGTKFVDVAVHGDVEFEADERMRLILHGAVATAFGSQVGFGAIQNDDAGSLQVLSAEAADDVLIQLSADAASVFQSHSALVEGEFALPLNLSLQGQSDVRDSFTIDFSANSYRSDRMAIAGGTGLIADELRTVAGTFDRIDHSPLSISGGTTRLTPFDSVDVVELNWSELEQVNLSTSEIGTLVVTIPSFVTDVRLADAESDEAGAMRIWSANNEFAPIRFTNPQLELRIVLEGADTSYQLVSLDPTFAGTVNIVPANVAPSLTVNDDVVSVNEGVTATNSGTYADSPGDPIVLSASLGSISDDGDGTWSWSFHAVDQLYGSRAVTITAMDSSGARTEATFSLVVNPVAPVANDLAASVTEDGQVAITLSGSDAGTPNADLIFTITSLPAEGQLLTQAGEPAQLGQTFAGPPTLTYEPGAAREGAGNDGFLYSVTDRGGLDGSQSDDAAVAISISKAVPDGQVSIDAHGIVRVGGTTGKDDIVIIRTGFGSNSKLHVKINGKKVSSNTPLSSVQEIRTWGRAGNDKISVLLVDVPTLIHGGAGNDDIMGGLGSNLIFGGGGNDRLVGGIGNDLLIGGTGADTTLDAFGDDLHIGSNVSNQFTDDFLRDVLASWASLQSQNQRFKDGLADDETVDSLFDSLGDDWFALGDGDLDVDLNLFDHDSVTAI